jgi:hypothetical protein
MHKNIVYASVPQMGQKLLFSDFKLLLHKSNPIQLFVGYVNWFGSYLTEIKSQVRVSGTISSTFEVQSGVRQGSVLGLCFGTCLLMT